MTLQSTQQLAKGAGDLSSISIIVATFFEALPHIAALASLIWVLIRIWETETVQKLVSKFRKQS